MTQISIWRPPLLLCSRSKSQKSSSGQFLSLLIRCSTLNACFDKNGAVVFIQAIMCFLFRRFVNCLFVQDLHFACSRGRSLISFWRKFETLERPSQAAWDLAGQAGHLSFPEFFLYWRPDFAGPHVQLQTGSLSGGNIPPGVVWPRRWWKEALRRRNALLELKRNCGDNCLRYVSNKKGLTPTRSK